MRWSPPATMYVVGQQLLSDGLFTGNLAVVNLATTPSRTPLHQRRRCGRPQPSILADDNTLWIGMTKCNNGERYAKGLPYGCHHDV